MGIRKKEKIEITSCVPLIAVNKVKPSQKNAGYRYKKYAKKLAEIYHAKSFSAEAMKYLDECIEYWQEWQGTEHIKSDLKKSIQDVYMISGNSVIAEKLKERGYNPPQKVNVTREQYLKKIYDSGIKIKDLSEISIRGEI